MKRVYKIILKTLLFIVAAFVLTIVSILIYMRWGYYDDMYAIEKKLNQIEGVRVLNIWGNEDITLEEIAARIEVKGKGELVLQDLAVGDYGYAERVSITEIGGYSFDKTSCQCVTGSIGVGSSLQIGTDSEFGKILKARLESPAKVVENYTKIYCLIDSIYRGSNLLHLTPDSDQVDIRSNEIIVRVLKSGSTDQDPFINLRGVEDRFKDAYKLPWNNKKCKEAKY